MVEKGSALAERRDDFSVEESLQDATLTAEAAREMHEIQAMFTVAKRFPRNLDKAFAELMASAKRPTFAEEAAYSFPRGDKTVTGPSINIAREAKRVWGNMRAGVRIMNDTAKSRRIRAEAWDLEKGGYEFAEDEFLKLIQRKVKQPDGTYATQWVTPDERDLRELTNRRAAILVRNCILALLPKDLIEDAMMICAATKKDTSARDPEGTRKRLIMNFMEYRVTPEMIAAKLGHPLAAATLDELAELVGVYQSIKDGQSTWREYEQGEVNQETPVPQPGVPSPGQKEVAAKVRESIKVPEKKKDEPAQPAAHSPAAQQAPPTQAQPPTASEPANENDNPTDEELLVPTRQLQGMPGGMAVIRKLAIKYAPDIIEGRDWPADPKVRIAYLEDLWMATNPPKQVPWPKDAKGEDVGEKPRPAIIIPQQPPAQPDAPVNTYKKKIKEGADFDAVMLARKNGGDDKTLSILEQDRLDIAMNERLAELRKNRPSTK